jgi:hypothetical protein
MAGEGFDSVNVVEIVDLFPWSGSNNKGRSTRMKQAYGRASRVIKDCPVPAHINIPTDHPLTTGNDPKSLNLWMDAVEDIDDSIWCSPVTEPPRQMDLPFPDLPVERKIELLNVGDLVEQYPLHYKGFGDNMKKRFLDATEDDIRQSYFKAYSWQQQESSAQMRNDQLRDYLNSIVGHLALKSARLCKEISGSVIGRYKNEYNARLKMQFGKPREELLNQELEAACRLAKEWDNQLSGISPS